MEGKREEVSSTDSNVSNNNSVNANTDSGINFNESVETDTGINFNVSVETNTDTNINNNNNNIHEDNFMDFSDKKEVKKEVVQADNNLDTKKDEEKKFFGIKFNVKFKSDIPLWKFNKVLSTIVIIVVIVTILSLLLQFVYEGISNFMWLNVNNFISEFNYNVMQNIPWFTSYARIVIIVICSIVIVANLVLEVAFKKNIKVRTIGTNIGLPIILILGLFVDYSLYFSLSSASHRGINEIYMKDFMNHKYEQKDLEDILDYFKNRIFTYAESLDRQNGEIVLSNSAYNMAVNDLKNLSAKYEFLKGNYPTKIKNLSDKDLASTGYPLGITYYSVVGIDNVGLSDLEKIFVLTHEFCHVKGIFRESDADYCAFLSGYNSNNDISKYSMYIGLFPNILHALKDKELFQKTVDEFGSMCLESGYDEICNIYTKDIYRFIKDSDTIELYTYSINVYKDKKEELKQYLLGLTNRFNVKIYEDEKDVISLEEANKLIDEESESLLYITGKINEKTYNENNEYLKVLSNYFPNLYLSNSSVKDEDYSNYNYIKPFETGSFISLTAKTPEFDYDRAVRSILEYFSKYIY